MAWLESNSDGGRKRIEGVARSVDISTQGAGLVFSQYLPVGERLLIELLLPGRLRLRAWGRIVHCSKHDEYFRVGVSFESAPVLTD